MAEIINLSEALDNFLKKINNGENFTLLRFGDGERAIMNGTPVTAQEGWSSPSRKTLLGLALERTLNIEAKNVYYGISCPCCDRASYYWYMSRIKNKNITFANLFVNANYRNFLKEFENLRRDAIVIANHRGEGHKIGNLNVIKYYSVGDNCVEFWEHDAQSLLEEIIDEYGTAEGLLYAVSAGPMSEPILERLYRNNPNNCYIDFGSSLDIYIHEKDTRPYTDPNSVYGKRDCWMYAPETTSFDVSVVITAYKKPDAIEEQLRAMEAQTLKPKEILLFQDGINGPYKITFSQEILKRFTNTYICGENKGVWERFRFAQSASSKYVCVFDDDTIPGEKWLENCHSCMIQHEGIYGTIGIVLEKYEEYPFGGFYRVGWDGPLNKITRVDFVGHAWFFERRYLDYMFDKTEKYQEFKYAGEDMCLSFKCQQHGINTFVPPHPNTDRALWGSDPFLALKYGQAYNAISQNHDNCEIMGRVLRTFVEDGWKLYCQEEGNDVKKTALQLREEKGIERKTKIESFLWFIDRGMNKVFKRHFNLYRRFHSVRSKKITR